MLNVVLVVAENLDPSNETVIEFTPERPVPFMSDGGDVNLLCGSCGFAICEKLTSATQVQAMVIRCPRCGKYNRTRT